MTMEQYVIRTPTLKEIADAIRRVRYLDVNIPTSELASALRTGRVLTNAEPTDSKLLRIRRQTLVDIADVIRERSGGTAEIDVDKLAKMILEVFKNATVATEGEDIKACVGMSGYIGSYLINYILIMGKINAYVDMRAFAKLAEIVKRAYGQIPFEVSMLANFNAVNNVEKRVGEINAQFEKMIASARANHVEHACGDLKAEAYMKACADAIWLVETEYACGRIDALAGIDAFAKANLTRKAYGNTAIAWTDIEGTAKIADESRAYSLMSATADVDGNVRIADKVIRVGGKLASNTDATGYLEFVEYTYLETECEDIEAVASMSGYTTTFKRKHIAVQGEAIEANAGVSGYVTTYKRTHITTSGEAIQAYADVSGYMSTYKLKHVTANGGSIEATAHLEGHAEIVTLIVIIEENEAGGLTYLITTDDYEVVDNAVYIGG